MIKYISIAVIVWVVFRGFKSLYQSIKNTVRPEESDVHKLIGMHTQIELEYYATIIGLIIGHIINMFIKTIVPIMVLFN